MRLTNNAHLGLIVSGTKRGKQVFFTSNVEDSIEMVDDEIVDIRKYYPPKRVGQEFYGLEFNRGYVYFSIFHTLNDELSRLGYLGITLVLPPGKALPSNCRTLLESLLSTYLAHYVDATVTTRQIRANVTEDVGLFESKLPLEPLSDDPFAESSLTHRAGVGYLEYQTPQDVDRIFSFHDREELNAYSNIILLPPQSDLARTVTILRLSPPSRKLRFTIAPTSVNGQALMGALVAVYGTKTGSRQLLADPDASFIAFDDEALTIEVTKADYHPESVSPAKIAKAKEEGGRFPAISVYLQEREKPRSLTPAPVTPSKSASTGATRTDYSEQERLRKKEDRKRMFIASGFAGLVVLGIGGFLLKNLNNEPENIIVGGTMVDSLKTKRVALLDSFKVHQPRKTTDRRDSIEYVLGLVQQRKKADSVTIKLIDSLLRVFSGPKLSTEQLEEFRKENEKKLMTYKSWLDRAIDLDKFNLMKDSAINRWAKAEYPTRDQLQWFESEIINRNFDVKLVISNDSNPQQKDKRSSKKTVGKKGDVKDQKDIKVQDNAAKTSVPKTSEQKKVMTFSAELDKFAALLKSNISRAGSYYKKQKPQVRKAIEERYPDAIDYVQYQ